MGNRSMRYGVPVFVLMCCICSINVVFGADSLLVNIRNGTLEGSIMTSGKGREFAAFRGIPFAQPPIGDLRFELPQPFGSWTGVRSAKEDSNFCIQSGDDAGSFAGSEDCLYLNVYRPKLQSRKGRKQKYPVMIWFYGGGYVGGSADSEFYGPQFLLDHDVVLVTVNYRLGPLGFLSTQDSVCPGNNGLKDQAQSIRWVHENIAAFNGDPNRVTLFGESSGACSVHHHMISHQVRGLFHRAISESGDVLNPWDLNRQQVAKNQSIKLGQLVNCPTDKSSELVKCLKKKNATELLATACPDTVFDNCPIAPFRAVIEPDLPGAYIKEEPLQSLKSGNVADVPWLKGNNAQEGAERVAGLLGMTDKPYAQIYDENFMELAPKSLGYDVTCREDLIYNVTKSIRDFYFGNKKISVDTKWNLLEMYTDAWYFAGSSASVKFHLQTLRAPVYFYWFAYRGTSSFSEVFGDPINNYGVSHGDELQYLFPVGKLIFPNATFSQEDNKVVDVMTKLWVNFAATGNPTPTKTPLIPVKWTPVVTPSLQYLYIGNSSNIHMAENLIPERANFWANLPYLSKIEASIRGCGH